MTQTFPKIYKTTSTGATQQWHMEINPDNKGQFRTVSGQVGGKLVKSGWRQAEPTNVGKKNERDAEAQALFEVEAKYKKKLDKDYHKDIKNIDSGSNIYECMLAQKYEDRLEKKVSKTNPEFTYKGLFSQPKLNGMRNLALKDGNKSRNGKPTVSCPHIEKALLPAHLHYPKIVFDGELYNHDLHDNFNELMSIFKQLKPTAEDLAKSAEFGEYHVYDIDVIDDSVSYEINGMMLTKQTPFSVRIKILKFLVEEIIQNKMVVLTRTDKVDSKEQLDALYDEYALQNYEGQMIRINEAYTNKRSWGLLKRKDFYDDEYILLDILPGKGNWAGKAKSAVLLCHGVDINNYDPVADTFDAGITGNMKFCKELLENKDKYIGKPTTVNFQVLSPDRNVPIFGRCKEFDRMDIS